MMNAKAPQRGAMLRCGQWRSKFKPASVRTVGISDLLSAMGVDWNNDADLNITGLLKSWKAAWKKYGEQIEEAKKAGTSHDHMQGCRDQLWECIHNLERATNAQDRLKK